jgi:hypothetical protein
MSRRPNKVIKFARPRALEEGQKLLAGENENYAGSS